MYKVQFYFLPDAQDTCACPRYLILSPSFAHISPFGFIILPFSPTVPHLSHNSPFSSPFLFLPQFHLSHNSLFSATILHSLPQFPISSIILHFVPQLFVSHNSPLSFNSQSFTQILVTHAIPCLSHSSPTIHYLSHNHPISPTIVHPLPRFCFLPQFLVSPTILWFLSWLFVSHNSVSLTISCCGQILHSLLQFAVSITILFLSQFPVSHTTLSLSLSLTVSHTIPSLTQFHIFHPVLIISHNSLCSSTIFCFLLQFLVSPTFLCCLPQFPISPRIPSLFCFLKIPCLSHNSLLLLQFSALSNNSPFFPTMPCPSHDYLSCIKFLYVLKSFSGLSMLFHWTICLFLFNYHIDWVL